MKVLHISESDLVGGAAKAAYRLHLALRRCGVDSEMRVRKKLSGDPCVIGPKGRFAKLTHLLAPLTDRAEPILRSVPEQSELHSAGRSLLSLVDYINCHPCNVVHLHWINYGFLSIEQISRIRKPIVWTLHDMWPFCGAEHYAPDNSRAPWVSGYCGKTKIERFNAAVHNRKIRNWIGGRFHVIATSEWMAQCAKRSLLMNNWRINEIPCAIDLSIFKPLDRAFCRTLLNLPSNKPLILLGSVGGGLRKGYDLLRDALHLKSDAFINLGLEMVIFGSSVPDSLPVGLRVHALGHLTDEHLLAALYNACDVMVVPSRQEAFGQTASEAQSCGVPVVAFAATGLLSIVENGKTGILVEPFNIKELAESIEKLLIDVEMRHLMGHHSRMRAIARWADKIVVNAHNEVYESAQKCY